MASIRLRRVGDQLRGLVSDLLTRKLEDPRLEGIRIVEVRVTPDLRNATLYFSVFPADDQRRVQAQAALERASGFIRREMGRGLRLRVVPSLRFVPDLAPEYADNIERLLAEVRPPGDDSDAEEPTQLPCDDPDAAPVTATSTDD